MNAFGKLEQGGIRFELTAEGQIAYHNTWPGEVPAEWVTRFTGSAALLTGCRHIG